MSTIPPKFAPPPTPVGFQRIGWRGFLLLLPEDWNLRLHDGDDRKGALAFTDLRSTRLEVRWQTPRRTPRAAISRLKTQDSQRTTFLLPSAARLYELHFPTPVDPDLQRTILEDFRNTLPRLDDHPDTLWQLYGLSAWLPKTARLRKASLLPGQTTLTFKTPDGALSLASVALADRLLHRQTLRQWAQKALPQLTGHPKAQWHESPMETTLTLQTRRLLRKTNHHLTLTHHPETNRLTYTHQQIR